jgi:hypothetical protein
MQVKTAKDTPTYVNQTVFQEHMRSIEQNFASLAQSIAASVEQSRITQQQLADVLHAQADAQAQHEARMDEIRAEAVTTFGRQMASSKPQDAGRTWQSLKNEDSAVSSLRKAGFGNVTPHVDCLTYYRWLDKGKIVKDGEVGVKPGGCRYTLFHVSQVREPASEQELLERRALQQAAYIRHGDKKRSGNSRAAKVAQRREWLRQQEQAAQPEQQPQPEGEQPTAA